MSPTEDVGERYANESRHAFAEEQTVHPGPDHPLLHAHTELLVFPNPRDVRGIVIPGRPAWPREPPQTGVVQSVEALVKPGGQRQALELEEP